MYFMLVNRIPALLSQPGNTLDTKDMSPTSVLSRKTAPPLLATAYPNIKWWKACDWKDHNDLLKGASDGSAPGPRGASRISKGINVAMTYVQYADGTVVNGHRVSSIKGYAAGVLHELGRRGLASPTWMQSGRDVREHVYWEICTKYPEMGLCEDDWKCQRMLIDMYPSWHTGFVAAQDKTKRKRSSAPKDSDASKRVKIKAAEVCVYQLSPSLRTFTLNQVEIDFTNMYTIAASSLRHYSSYP